MNITRGLEVETTKDTVCENNLIVSKGTKLKVGGADFEGDFALYLLTGTVERNGEQVEINVWAYINEFKKEMSLQNS